MNKLFPDIELWRVTSATPVLNTIDVNIARLNMQSLGSIHRPFQTHQLYHRSPHH